MMSKGSKQRPYNKSKFDENFDKIFNKRTKIEGENNTSPSDKNQVEKSKSTLQKWFFYLEFSLSITCLMQRYFAIDAKILGD